MLLDLAFCVMLCRLLFVLLSFFFWPLCCLSFDLRLLITSLVSFVHCVVCPLIYVFWLPLWYLLTIVLSVLWSTASDYLFGIFWPLCCLSFDLRLLITSLVSFDHCVVCPLILCLLITPLVSFGHCVVCPLIYGFWLPLWYLLAIVLSVLWSTSSDYPVGIFWPLCCLSFDFMSSDYPFGIFWPLCCLSFDLRLLITPLVSFDHCVVCPLILCLLITPLVSFVHCVVCPLIYVFWLPLWYLLAIVLCPLIYGFWLPLWYLLSIVLSVLWSTASDYPVGIFWPLCCLSFDFMSSDYPFGIFWPLCCLSFDLRLPITPLVSFGHCVVCPLIYVFWLPLWYLLSIVLSVLWFTSSDNLFGIFCPLCCLSFDLRLPITSLVSFVHCVVCPLIYVFWLPLWYLQLF
jgi:hypothetical protein